MFNSKPRWSLAVWLLLGFGTLWCWWQIRELGDVRLRLGAFYGWFALAFALYLITLWAIAKKGDVWKNASVPFFIVMAVAYSPDGQLHASIPLVAIDVV